MSANEKITIRYEYSVADAVEAFRLYDSTTPRRTVSKFIGIVSLAFAGLTAYSYAQLTRLYGKSYGAEWFAIGLLVIALVAWFDPILSLRAWLVYRMNSKIYTDQSEVTFDEVGVHARTNTYDKKRLWTAYSSVLESKRLFLLVHGKGAYATIPKRAFTDEQQIQAFREILKRRIGYFG